MFESIDALAEKLAAERYVCDRATCTSVYLALRTNRPVLLEGEPGVGKATLGQSLARALGSRLIVLTCHEGIDEQEAVSEWNVARQLLRIQLAGANREPFERVEHEVAGRDYLIERPLLAALAAGDAEPPVLLVDGVDRAERRFDAFLAGVLSTFSVTIPGHGVVTAKRPPRVVVTSDSSRALDNHLKSACVYQWIDHPKFEHELQILVARVPGISPKLAGQVCNFVDRLHEAGFVRPPGIAETLAWGQALSVLHRTELTPEIVDQTLGCLLKDRGDIARFRGQPLDRMLGRAVDRVA